MTIAGLFDAFAESNRRHEPALIGIATVAFAAPFFMFGAARRYG